MRQEHAAALATAAASNRKRSAPAAEADHAKRTKLPGDTPDVTLVGDDRKLLTYPNLSKGGRINGECFFNNCDAKHRWQTCDKPENQLYSSVVGQLPLAGLASNPNSNHR